MGHSKFGRLRHGLEKDIRQSDDILAVADFDSSGTISDDEMPSQQSLTTTNHNSRPFRQIGAQEQIHTECALKRTFPSLTIRCSKKLQHLTTNNHATPTSGHLWSSTMIFAAIVGANSQLQKLACHKPYQHVEPLPHLGIQQPWLLTPCPRGQTSDHRWTQVN